MFKINFAILSTTGVVKKWTCTNQFASKQEAMIFAQNTAKGFNGTDWRIYYFIIFS